MAGVTYSHLRSLGAYITAKVANGQSLSQKETADLGRVLQAVGKERLRPTPRGVKTNVDKRTKAKIRTAAAMQRSIMVTDTNGNEYENVVSVFSYAQLAKHFGVSESVITRCATGVTPTIITGPDGRLEDI